MGRRRPYVTSFVREDGRRVALEHPHEAASSAQLQKLNQLGLLDIVRPGTVAPVTKGEAAATIAAALAAIRAARERQAATRAELDRDPEGWGE